MWMSNLQIGRCSWFITVSIHPEWLSRSTHLRGKQPTCSSSDWEWPSWRWTGKGLQHCTQLEKAAQRPGPRRRSWAHPDSSLSFSPPRPSPLNSHPLTAAGEPSPHFTLGLETSQLVPSAQFLCLFPQPSPVSSNLLAQKKNTSLQMSWHPHLLPRAPLSLSFDFTFISLQQHPLSLCILAHMPSLYKEIKQTHRTALPKLPLCQLPAPAAFFFSLTCKLL